MVVRIELKYFVCDAECQVIADVEQREAWRTSMQTTTVLYWCE
jgi:hypothetical protein